MRMSLPCVGGEDHSAIAIGVKHKKSKYPTIQNFFVDIGHLHPAGRFLQVMTEPMSWRETRGTAQGRSWILLILKVPSLPEPRQRLQHQIDIAWFFLTRSPEFRAGVRQIVKI
jgi:hypothetical protein